MVERRTADDVDFSKLVRRGDLVCWGQGPAEPLPLTRRLMEQRHEIGGFRCFIGIGWSGTPNPEFADVVRFSSYCAAGTNRKLAKTRALEIWPQHYSRMAEILPDRVDVLLIQVARTANAAEFSFGLACEYLLLLVKSARLVIAEVNDQTPLTAAEAFISADDIDVLVETDRDIPEPSRMKSGSAEAEIARHIAGLVEDGATLQVGLGSIPETVLPSLAGHRNLGVHSGLVSDSVIDLIECGVINNARKPRDARYLATGLLAGSKRLSEFARRHHDQIKLRSTSFTHDREVLAELEKFTAINSAIEVDLFGQVNSEMAGGIYVGAVGGLADFMRGARASAGGLPIIALPATAKARDGHLISKIVASLSGPATLPHADAPIVITEYGIADLRDLDYSARAQRLVQVAHPDFREELERSAWTLAR